MRSTLVHLTPVLASGLLVALLARAMWRDRRLVPGAGPYAAALLAQLVWLVGYAGELLAPDLAAKLLWDDVTWIATAVVGGAALRFAGERTARRRSGNAMLLVVAGFPAAFIGVLFTGSLLIEVIFSLDGLGLLGFEAAINRDYPVMFGTLYFFTLIGLLLGIVGDLMYVVIDPRIDFEARRA